MVLISSEAPPTSQRHVELAELQEGDQRRAAGDHDGADVGHQVQDAGGHAPDRRVLSPSAQKARPVARPTPTLASSCTSR